MKKSEKIERKTQDHSKEIIILSLIVIGVIIVGVIGLYVLQKLSLKNKYICTYLGGLWERKVTDRVHRCYTYEEFYRD